MKNFITILIGWVVVLVACAPPETFNVAPDASPGTVHDGGTVDRDASAPRITDINHPLTPDDPCRQLKMTFEVDVIAADAAYLGELLVVAYQTETGSFVSTYRDEMLETTWPIPAGQPRLFHARDDLMVATGGRMALRIEEDAPPAPVSDFAIVSAGTWQIEGLRTGDDDMLVYNTAYDGGGGYQWSLFLNGQRGSGTSTVAGGPVAMAFWPERIGAGADAVVYGAEVNVGITGISTISVSLPISSFGAVYGESATIGTPGAPMPTVASAVMTSPDDVVIAVQRYSPTYVPEVEYREVPVGRALGLPIRVASGVVMATHGAALSTTNAPRDVLFVELHTNEDLLSRRWEVYRFGDQHPLAVARDGHAGSVVQPGPLHAYDRRIMWAGPTIQDQNTPNYPSDAIAVCELDVPM